MDTIKFKNFSNEDVFYINDKTKYIECNFSKKEDTVLNFICDKDIKHLEFEECNLINCIIPEFSIVNECNTAKVIEKDVKEKIIIYDEAGDKVIEKTVIVDTEITIKEKPDINIGVIKK